MTNAITFALYAVVGAALYIVLNLRELVVLVLFLLALVIARWFAK